MHPLFYGIATFQPLVELLAVDARLVTVDPRGTGGSDSLPPGYSHRAHVEDARAVIRALGDAPVVLVGISRGGSLAVQFAAEYPDLVEALVLIGVTPMSQSAADYPDPEVREAWQRVVAAVEIGDHDLANRIFLSMTLTEPGAQKAVDAALATLRTLSPEVIRNFFLADQDARDIRPLLPKLRVRTLVIHGEGDRLTPLEAGRYVAAQIPGAHFHVARGRQHNVLRTAPSEVAGLIRDFLGLGGPSTSGG
jgi:pimeloyl-ACP methyl ester carboxylesterase